MSWHPNGGTAVSNTRAERPDVTSLVATRQTELVVLSIHSNVLVMPLAELGDGGLDCLHTSRLTHSLGTVVGVATSTVPVTGERLRVEGNLDTPLLGDTLKEVTSHPEVVAHRDTLTGPNLELPLRRHDFGVDTADVDASVQARPVMRFYDITCENLAST